MRFFGFGEEVETETEEEVEELDVALAEERGVAGFVGVVGLLEDRRERVGGEEVVEEKLGVEGLKANLERAPLKDGRGFRRGSGETEESSSGSISGDGGRFGIVGDRGVTAGWVAVKVEVEVEAQAELQGSFHVTSLKTVLHKKKHFPFFSSSKSLTSPPHP